MARIKGANTKPEIVVRKLLHGMGFRFRLHDKGLPGKPDIVLPRHRRIVLVNGCFWHGHLDCKRAKLPASNVDFWQVKISSNIERDKRNIEALHNLGWRVLVVWACEMRDLTILTKKLKGFMSHGEAA